MMRFTSVSKLTILLVTLFFIAIQVNATNITPPSRDGGPRNIIQGLTEIVVDQPVAEHLDITILDEDGRVVVASSTRNVRTTISIVGWGKGDYTVQTINDDADYQEQVIVID